MKTFELKNADAQDVAKQLQDLGKDQDSDNDSPYRILLLSAATPTGRTPRRSASWPIAAAMPSWCRPRPPRWRASRKTIAALDEPIQDNSLAPKIVPLENVSAGDIEDVLNELFLKKTTQRSYYDYSFDSQPEADRDVGRLYGKVRITSEAAANALIITANSQENLDAVIAVVKELDKPSAAGDTTFHVKLNFGNAQKIANRINILFAKNGSQALRPVNQPNPMPPTRSRSNSRTSRTPRPRTTSRWNRSSRKIPIIPGSADRPMPPGATALPTGRTDRPVSDLVGRVRVVPDEASSSLLVTANIHLFAQVSKMIEEMDVPPAAGLDRSQAGADFRRLSGPNRRALLAQRQPGFFRD